MSNWFKLLEKHSKIFGYHTTAPYIKVIGNPEEEKKLIELLQKSIAEKKDYMVGHYGITEEYIKQWKSGSEEDILWD